MRDRGFKIDDYDLVLVNFNHIVDRGELITDEPYVLTSQVDQVFYVKYERNPRNVYNFGQGEGSHDEGATYHECEPLVLTSGNLYDMNGEFKHDRLDIDPIEAPIG